mmetsp:Transcript_493/g.1844  ORF Transcript_493/g.1844 Transcript_493/m.1844 type:complete len:191 (+) Transcript_493:163-735(+)
MPVSWYLTDRGAPHRGAIQKSPPPITNPIIDRITHCLPITRVCHTGLSQSSQSTFCSIQDLSASCARLSKAQKMGHSLLAAHPPFPPVHTQSTTPHHHALKNAYIFTALAPTCCCALLLFFHHHLFALLAHNQSECFLYPGFMHPRHTKNSLGPFASRICLTDRLHLFGCSHPSQNLATNAGAIRFLAVH